MARRKTKGSSKAGRPRKSGDRYPSGKLKPPAPNEALLTRRKAGDASAGEHPLDFALSRQWITEQMHRDAMSYRAAFNLSHIGGPRMSCGSLAEVPPSETLRMNWSQMSDAEIVDIFDRVFSGDIQPEDRPKLEAAALERWKRLNVALSATEREELFLVCVLGSWPFWMPKKASAHALGVRDLTKEENLLHGLSAIARALRPPKRQTARITPLPFKRARAGRTEVPVRYETDDGLEVQPEATETGKPFEVTILRRRA
jgi:hypothetical protein